MFDILAIGRRLTDAGLSEKQAGALADTLREVAEHDTAGCRDAGNEERSTRRDLPPHTWRRSGHVPAYRVLSATQAGRESSGPVRGDELS